VFAPEPVEPDLMVGLCDGFVTTFDELNDWLFEIMEPAP
jgi:hypothetical protein